MGCNKNLKVFSGSSQYWLSFLTLFSFALGAANVPMMILTFILLIATFGVGFSVKRNIVKQLALKIIYHCIDFIRSTQRQLLNVIVLLIRTCTFKSNIIKVLDTI